MHVFHRKSFKIAIYMCLRWSFQYGSCNQVILLHLCSSILQNRPLPVTSTGLQLHLYRENFLPNRKGLSSNHNFSGASCETSGGYPLTTPFITLDFCWRWLDKIPELFPKWWWKMVFYHSRIRKNITLNKQTTVSRRGPKQFWRTFENNSLRNSKYRLFQPFHFWRFWTWNLWCFTWVSGHMS